MGSNSMKNAEELANGGAIPENYEGQENGEEISNIEAVFLGGCGSIAVVAVLILCISHKTIPSAEKVTGSIVLVFSFLLIYEIMQANKRLHKTFADEDDDDFNRDTVLDVLDEDDCAEYSDSDDESTSYSDENDNDDVDEVFEMKTPDETTSFLGGLGNRGSDVEMGSVNLRKPYKLVQVSDKYNGEVDDNIEMNSVDLESSVHTIESTSGSEFDDECVDNVVKSVEVGKNDPSGELT